MDKIQIKIFTPQEYNHSSYIQTGLFELEKENFLKNQIILSFKKRLGTIKTIDSKVEYTNQPHPKTSFYELNNSNKTISFATDLYDDARSFSKFALDNCQYVFKRNYESQYIKLLPIEYQKKIFPLGLTFKICSENQRSNWKFITGCFLTNLLLSIKTDGLFIKRLTVSYKNQIIHLQERKSNQPISFFEKKVISSLKNTIFFQTRFFPHDTNDDVKQIHQQRFEIVMLLKKHFENIFKGGLISSKLVANQYNEALTNVSSNPKEYLEALDSSKIVIYTRGLINSPAWKMAEYLATGKVIIAEKLTAELPLELQNSKHVLFFNDNDELIKQIERVLNDEKLCVDLSSNARKYFDEIVHPKINIKRIINFMLNENK